MLNINRAHTLIITERVSLRVRFSIDIQWTDYILEIRLTYIIKMCIVQQD